MSENDEGGEVEAEIKVPSPVESDGEEIVLPAGG